MQPSLDARADTVREDVFTEKAKALQDHQLDQLLLSLRYKLCIPSKDTFPEQ